MNMDFRKFLSESEKKNMTDVKATLSKIPNAHKELTQKYNFKFEPDNTLKGSDEYVGELDTDKKDITVAAPWNYGREYAILHEIGHLVWEKFITPKLKKKWSELVKRTKHKQEQNQEELFCMAYANTYAQNKIEIHNHDHWEEFIKNLPK